MSIAPVSSGSVYTHQSVAKKTTALITQSIRVGGVAKSRITPQPTISLSNGVYFGQSKDGVPNGRGRLNYHTNIEERRFYKGNFVNGLPHGQGMMKWHSGKKYEGNWEFGVMSGQGKTTWPDKSFHEGQYDHDEMHGKGIYDSEKLKIRKVGLFQRGVFWIGDCQTEERKEHYENGHLADTGCNLYFAGCSGCTIL